MKPSLGVAWFFLYGYYNVPAATYLPQLREIGGSFTKVYLFWQQLEPEKGKFDWTALDAFSAQLNHPEEGLISLFSSSQWATQRASGMLPPSPAKDLEDYYHFVFQTVKRAAGRVRYWQNDSEPNNPVFWAGTKEEFVAQLRVFHRAVKDADPEAMVVVGGYDGLFIPPDMIPLPGQNVNPFPHQKEGLDFFEYVVKEGVEAFDVFDLRLYGDVYSITARIEYFERKLRAVRSTAPIICTEYGGPNFFELKENRKYLPLIGTWTQSIDSNASEGAFSPDPHSVNQIGQLYREMNTLAPQTQMFMEGCSAELEEKYYRIQSRGLVMRNLFALTAGVQKTLYWDLLYTSGPRDDLMTLMYGKIGLLVPDERGLSTRKPAANVFARFTALIDGLVSVRRIVAEDQPNQFLFEIDRAERGRLYIIWERRDLFSGEEQAATAISIPWEKNTAQAADIFGQPIPTLVSEKSLHLAISDTPICVQA